MLHIAEVQRAQQTSSIRRIKISADFASVELRPYCMRTGAFLQAKTLTAMQCCHLLRV